jgi:hypothetical protein
MKTLLAAARLLLALAPSPLVAACNGAPPPLQCPEIPKGGCPPDNGATVCSDPTCAAIYDCVNGAWSLQMTCPQPPHDAAAADAHEAAPDGGLPLDATTIDAPPGAFGGPGCISLEMPDCPAGTGLECASQLGCCGCQDLFVCDDGGWNLWGECGDAGVTVFP